MPQSQKPSIKIIPRQEEKEPPWVNVALVIGGLLLVVVIVPLFLSRGKVSQLEERKQDLDEQVVAILAEYQSMSKGLADIEERINDFSTLFREHRITSSIFDFIGSICHPLAQFTDFKFSDKDFHVIVNVTTENFKTLGEQLLILKQNENIKNPKVTGIRLDRDGFVNAKFGFDLDQKLIMPFHLEVESDSATSPPAL